MKSNLPEMVRENNNVFGDNIAFIKEYDFSRANSSHEARLNAVTTVASICYQAPDKIGSEGLYDRLANEDIGIPSSSFAFIPVLISDSVLYDFMKEDYIGRNLEKLPDCSTFGEFIVINNTRFLLTNLRALLQDLGWTTDFKKAQELSEKYFNTSEEDIEIIKKFYKVYKVKMDIATSKQWNRHNFHLQELSRRYVSGKKVPFDFYIDEKMQKVISIHPTEIIEEFTTQQVIDICMNHYYSALEQGVKPQDARRIIPQGAYTEIWTGMMPRVLDNMLKLRTKPKTQWEFRQLALQIAEWEGWSEQTNL